VSRAGRSREGILLGRGIIGKCARAFGPRTFIEREGRPALVRGSVRREDKSDRLNDAKRGGCKKGRHFSWKGKRAQLLLTVPGDALEEQ